MSNPMDDLRLKLPANLRKDVARIREHYGIPLTKVLLPDVADAIRRHTAIINRPLPSPFQRQPVVQARPSVPKQCLKFVIRSGIRPLPVTFAP